MLADDMGLGKTLSSIGFLSLLPRGKKVTIIAPAILVSNWQTEIQKFNPSLFRKLKIEIKSYEKQLSSPTIETDILILDEVQKIEYKTLALQTRKFEIDIKNKGNKNLLDFFQALNAGTISDLLEIKIKEN